MRPGCGIFWSSFGSVSYTHLTDIREETKGTAETADGEAGTSGETRDWNMFSWTLLPWKKTGMDFITFSILQNPIL